MEVAATVVVGAGIKAVFANSFARTYFRNAINNGLTPVQCDTSAIKELDKIAVTMTDDGVEVRNDTQGHSIRGATLPNIMLSILAAGGLVEYMRRHGDFKA